MTARDAHDRFDAVLASARAEILGQGATLALRELTAAMQPYPATSDGCCTHLVRMMAIDSIAALRPWGLGRVMGFNAEACGYPDVRDIVAACMESEIAQFRCMLGFIQSAKLGPAQKGKDWHTFVRFYNGSGQVDAYASKLSRPQRGGWRRPESLWRWEQVRRSPTPPASTTCGGGAGVASSRPWCSPAFRSV